MIDPVLEQALEIQSFLKKHDAVNPQAKGSFSIIHLWRSAGLYRRCKTAGAVRIRYRHHITDLNNKTNRAGFCQLCFAVKSLRFMPFLSGTFRSSAKTAVFSREIRKKDPCRLGTGLSF